VLADSSHSNASFTGRNELELIAIDEEEEEEDEEEEEAPDGFLIKWESSLLFPLLFCFFSSFFLNRFLKLN